MGAMKLFASIASRLAADPTGAANDTLEEIAACYESYAYIGNRKQLKNIVLAQSKKLEERLIAQSGKNVKSLLEINPELNKSIKQIMNANDRVSEVTASWFGSQWKKNSGLFPDFVLAWDEKSTFGNGALIELKDAKSSTVASFNSTIPTRLKSLDEVCELTGSDLVCRATMLCDLPNSIPTSKPRTCFYLIRTCAKDPENVCISLVEGSFFETLPKNELLIEVWRQLLKTSDFPTDECESVVKALGKLKQSEIVQSRTIPKASVRPRLRLMAEVHTDANPHNYNEIPAKTVNLIIKREWNDDWGWLEKQFGLECIKMSKLEDDLLKVFYPTNDSTLRFSLQSIQHKRNGPHLILQFKLNL